VLVVVYARYNRCALRDASESGSAARDCAEATTGKSIARQSVEMMALNDGL
jgi:hypothetical protein